MSEPLKWYGKSRSIVRRIGSMLPLKPPPKIYVSVTPLHSMTSSMINEEINGDCTNTNEQGSERLPHVRPDLLEPISFGSEVRLLALEQELQELREQISTIVKTNKQSRSTTSTSLANGVDSKSVPHLVEQPQSSLPPPTPHIARRASLQDYDREEHKRVPFGSLISMTDLLQDNENVKLKSVARSPCGHSLRIKHENNPCNDLQDILRRRYVATNAADSRNSSVNLTMSTSPKNV